MGHLEITTVLYISQVICARLLLNVMCPLLIANRTNPSSFVITTSLNMHILKTFLTEKKVVCDVCWTVHHCDNWRIKKPTRCHFLFYCTSYSLTCMSYWAVFLSRQCIWPLWLTQFRCNTNSHNAEALLAQSVLPGTYILLITPWCRSLFEKLTDFQLVKNLLTFYGTRRFITTVKSSSFQAHTEITS